VPSLRRGPASIVMACAENVERYRRLLKTATDEERRNYLGRLIVEEQQKQKDAGDSEYQY
jgi:hypothetical protein